MRRLTEPRLVRSGWTRAKILIPGVGFRFATRYQSWLLCLISGSSDQCVFCLVEAEDLELEEREVAAAVRLALHGFDLVVGPLQRAGRDRVLVVVPYRALVAF